MTTSARPSFWPHAEAGDIVKPFLADIERIITGDVWMNDAASVTVVQGCPCITVTSPEDD
jgi:hypothetical protein